MINRILTERDVKRMKLEPQGRYYGDGKDWEYYENDETVCILAKLINGKFKVRSWVEKENN